MMNANYLWLPNCFGHYPTFPLYPPPALDVPAPDERGREDVREKYESLREEHVKLQEKYEQLQKVGIG